jgi:radical SAM protein with 4Fe4S-binding SPASM domain
LNERHDELSCAEIEKMGDSIGRLQRVHIGGGEPFLRPDIGDIVTAISKVWNVDTICLPTNGWATGAIVKTIRQFGSESSNSLRLHFSLNTLPEDMDDFTGKKGSFDRWIESITRAKATAKPYKNITVTVLSTYNDFNQSYFPRLMDYVLKKVGVDDFSFCLVRAHHAYSPKLDLEQFERLLNDYFRNENRQGPLLRAYRELVREVIASYYHEPRLIVPCLSGKMRVVISPEGDIYPCETLGYPSGTLPQEWCMGNIRKYNYNIRGLLASEAARKIRNNIGARRCHCQQGIDLSLNLLCSNRFKIRLLQRLGRCVLQGL